MTWPRNRLAAFSPHRTDDLRDGAAEYVGQVTEWVYVGVVDFDSPYEGQTQWSPRDPGWPFAWVPDCDLVDVS